MRFFAVLLSKRAGSLNRNAIVQPDRWHQVQHTMLSELFDMIRGSVPKKDHFLGKLGLKSIVISAPGLAQVNENRQIVQSSALELQRRAEDKRTWYPHGPGRESLGRFEDDTSGNGKDRGCGNTGWGHHYDDPGACYARCAVWS